MQIISQGLCELDTHCGTALLACVDWRKCGKGHCHSRAQILGTILCFRSNPLFLAIITHSTLSQFTNWAGANGVWEAIVNSADVVGVLFEVYKKHSC